MRRWRTWRGAARRTEGGTSNRSFWRGSGRRGGSSRTIGRARSLRRPAERHARQRCGEKANTLDFRNRWTRAEDVVFEFLDFVEYANAPPAEEVNIQGE